VVAVLEGHGGDHADEPALVFEQEARPALVGGLGLGAGTGASASVFPPIVQFEMAGYRWGT
jgi:hypothetical protein